MPYFTITLSSGEREWSRFRVRLMCEMQDAAGSRTGFAASEDVRGGECVLTTGECSMIRLFVYAVPESLPAERRVYLMHDFDAVLRVRYGGRTISEERLEINNWGGTSAERLYDGQGRIGR